MTRARHALAFLLRDVCRVQALAESAHHLATAASVDPEFAAGLAGVIYQTQIAAVALRRARDLLTPREPAPDAEHEAVSP